MTILRLRSLVATVSVASLGMTAVPPAVYAGLPTTKNRKSVPGHARAGRAKTDAPARKTVQKPVDAEASLPRERFVRGASIRPIAKVVTDGAVETARRAGDGAEETAAAVAAVFVETEESGPRAPAAPATDAVAAKRFSRSDGVVRTALSFRGTPYRMGATGRGAFDCSGFTSYLFARAGSPLPRTAAEQFARGASLTKDQLRPGDLVFFKNTYKQGVSHVGIYIGNGNFIHASSSGRGVRVDSLGKTFYANHWAGARRPR